MDGRKGMGGIAQDRIEWDRGKKRRREKKRRVIQGGERKLGGGA